MAAIRREIKEVEAQLELAEAEFGKVNERLRVVQQDRNNVEEELVTQNMRLKQMLDELEVRKEDASREASQVVVSSKVTMAELDRKVDAALLDVLEAKFRDEAFATAIIEQSAASSGDKENYTFEMLLADAARYWDVSPNDAVLNDERGAVWPDDAYVALELQNAPSATIALRIKATATVDDEDQEYFGAEGDGSEISEEEDQDFMAIAEAAEDELLIAQAKGAAANLTVKQKLALRRKMRRELLYFVAFSVLYLYVLYTRRAVQNGFFMQQGIATAFVDEAFGDYNEKVYEDIATPEEAFDWMEGPLSDGLFPDEYYNGQEIPQDRRGYVMAYNKVVGKVRLRQLRVKKNGCKLADAVVQTGTKKDGSPRQRQLIDYCFPPYYPEVRDEEAFGPPELQQPGGGFIYSTAEDNLLATATVEGQVGTYDGSGFVLDLDSTNRTAYLETLAQLKANRWIDRQTRAILISLNTYNGNFDFLCVSTFILEFAQGGSVVASYNQKVLLTDMWTPEYFGLPDPKCGKSTDAAGRRLSEEGGSSEQCEGKYINLARSIPEMLSYFYTLCYIMHFTYKLVRNKRVTGSFRNHFRDAWNVVDVIFFGLMGVAGFMRVSYYLDPQRIGFNIFRTEYQEMGALAAGYNQVFVIECVSVLLLAIKSVKYFSLQTDLMALKGTLYRAVQDLIIFVMLMMLILLGFVLMALNIFGSQASGYKDVPTTLGTLFLILLGEFDYDEMKEVDVTWAVIFFLAYVVFMFFIVLNIFLAILNDAYTTVKTNHVWEELDKRKPLSLREKFEVRKAMWRERRNLKYIKKLKAEKVKEAKKAKKEFEKKTKEKSLMTKIGHRKRKEKKQKEEAEADGDAKQTRTQRLLNRSKARPH